MNDNFKGNLAGDTMIFSDSELTHNWQLVLGGDAQAFADFVDQHKNLVTSIAYALTGDFAGSEDIAQEAFLIAWQSRHELNEPDKLVGWLSSITRNLARQWLRKCSAKSWAAAGLEDANISHTQVHPSERLVSDEEQQIVWSTLETIPENYREVLILYYRESHSITDVALALEITEEAARQRLSRGRQLLRAEVERTIESALTRSRPSAAFTSTVIALIATSSSSTVGKTATAAAMSAFGKTAAQSALLGVTKTAATGAMLGAAGGLMGAAGGLFGTWIGIRVPQLMAPTMTERRLLEREGRFIWRLALMFVLATVVSVVVALKFVALPNAVISAVLINMLLMIGFAGVCIVRGVRLNKQIQQLRRTLTPEEDPNPTWLKDRLGVAPRAGMAKWVGRRATSQHRLLGWPLFDFQVSDPSHALSGSQALHAKGWIAIGDKATGFVAIGGLARGVVAIGGMSLGLVSFGGLAVGLITVGGLALGCLAIGGLAIGHSALGGGAVGWQAAGGGAVGVYSANGGLAIAGHMADGGLAISWKYAVGGEAKAPEANTQAAREACAQSWVANYFNTDAIIKDRENFHRTMRIYGTFLPVAMAVILAVGVPCLMYRRQPTSNSPAETPSEN